MKKSLFATAVLIVTFITGLRAQDCVYFFPANQGSSVETMSYDGKNKLTGINIQRVTSKEVNGDEVKITVETENFEAGGKSNGKSSIEYFCRNGIFYIDMKKFIDPSMKEQYKDMEVNIEASDMALPPSMKAGDLLADSYVSMSVSTNGIALFSFKIRIYNRKVEGTETITTTAGSFECFKISYEVETTTMFTIKTKGTDWIAKNTGVVKSESYDATGKLLGYSVITKIKN